MSKKDKQIIKEDKEIKNVAMGKNNLFRLAIFCCLLFALALLITIQTVKNYNKKSINITRSDNNIVLITNNGLIDEKITNNLFNGNEYTIARENIIENISAVDSQNKYSYKMVLDIIKNNFADENSKVYARFSYSNDGTNWKYLNNSITLDNKIIDAEMGNYYDISGVENNINIYSDQLELDKVSKATWKCEILFKKGKSNITDRDFNAIFKIVYVN